MLLLMGLENKESHTKNIRGSHTENICLGTAGLQRTGKVKVSGMHLTADLPKPRARLNYYYLIFLINSFRGDQGLHFNSLSS